MPPIRTLAGSLAVACLAATAQAQPPAPAQPCLTNACSQPASILTGRPPRNEAAIAAAIRGAHVGDLIRAGGSPREAGDILRARCDKDFPPCARVAKTGTEEYRIASDGSVVLYGAAPSEGPAPFVFINTDDMRGIAPTRDMRPVVDANKPGAPEARGMTLLPPPK